MNMIGLPLTVPEMQITPEPAGGVEISDHVQQTFALLAGFWRNQRVLLKATPTGTLTVASRQIKDVVNVTGVGANDTYDGPDVQCSEVLITAHPDNTGRIWVRPHATAAADAGHPLDAGDSISWGLTNLSMLHALIVVAGEKLILDVTE